MGACKMTLRTLATWTVCAAFALSIAAAANAQMTSVGDAQAGRALALQACTGCHVVAPDQPFKPIYKGELRPPDFADIARSGLTAATLQHHLDALPTIPQNAHMANPALTGQQLRDVVAFIVSLRDK